MVILAEDIQEHFWSHFFFHLVVTLSIEIFRFLIVRIVGGGWHRSTKYHIFIFKTDNDDSDNKKSFQWDAYCPFAKHTCFGGHQMSVLVGGPQINKFEEVCSDGCQVSLVGAWGRGPHVPCLEEGRGTCTVRSKALWVMVTWGSSSPEQNDRQTPVKTLPFHNFVGGR